MKNYWIVIFMWFNLVCIIIVLNCLKIPIIFKTIVYENIETDGTRKITFLYKNEELDSPESVYFFTDKAKKVYFKDYLEINKEHILVNNNNNYQLPKNLIGFIHTHDETILKYILKSIF